MRFELLVLRKKAGLTQKQFAKKIGMKAERYCRIEREEVKPTVDEAFIIADAVGRDVRTLFL
jgi:DNA-binding XRE family transcriptional regulator